MYFNYDFTEKIVFYFNFRLWTQMSFDTLYSGLIAGATSSIATWPLCVIQVQRQIYGHIKTQKAGDGKILHLIWNIYSKQGIPGFYRGVSKGIWAYSLFYGSFFYTNDLLRTFSKDAGVNDSPILILLRSYIAAGIGSIISNPHHVVRVRCQSSLLQQSHRPTNIREIWRKEGPGALTKGLRTTLIKNWEISIVMTIHDYLSNQYDYPAYFSSGIGKLVATSITYPLDSYRTIQRFDPSLSMRQILSNFRETPKKIYWGYGAYLCRSVPATIIAFNVQSLLTRKN